MKNKSIGKLVLIVLLAPSCGGGGGGSKLVIPTPAMWATQQVSPTSSDLRAVIFSNLVTGIVVGKNGTIFRTDDGGGTWLQEDFTPANRTGDLTAIAGLNTTLLAVGSDAAGGARMWSSGNALAWTTPNTAATGARYTDVALAAASFSSPVASYRLRLDGTLDFTLDTGATGTNSTGTWTNANGLVYLGTQGFGLVCGDNGGAGQLSRTSNGGGTWTPATLPAGVSTLRRVVFTQSLQPFACGDNTSANGIVLMMDLTDLTQNTWIAVPSNPGGLASLQAIFFPVDQNTGWVVGNNGTIYRLTFNTTSSTWTWTNQNPGNTVTSANLYGAYFIDNDHGWIVGDGGTVLSTSNGSAATGPWWTAINKGTTGIVFNASSFTDDGVKGLAVGNSGKIFRTIDGGTTWTSMASSLTTQNLLGVAVPRSGSGTTAYICGTAGTLMVNTDAWGVGTWTATGITGTTNTDTYNAILFPQDQNKGVCVGATGGGAALLLRTSNGLAWTAPTPGGFTTPSGAYTALSANLAGTKVYAASGANGLISRSADSANAWMAWTDLAPALGGSLTLPAVQSPEGTNYTAFAAASDGNVYRLTAGGTPAWGAGGAIGSNPVSLGFQGDLDGLVVTSTGAVLYTIDGATSWIPTYPHTKAIPRAVWMSPTVAGLGYIVTNDGTIMKTLTSGH